MVDLITERQTHGFLGKISESHGTNLSREQYVSASENYDNLNPTEILDLCYSVVQFIPLDIGFIVVG